MGKLAKFFKEMTLLNQTFVKTNKEDVRTYLKSSDSELTVNEFKRYGLVN
jgi:elongation factor Ts